MKEFLGEDEVKNELLGLMERFHSLCVEESLNYSLAYGTLIGAVRHKGFIPWDDDVDVLMPRNDYERLIKILGIGGRNRYGLETYTNLDASITPFVKYVDRNIRVESSSDRFDNYLWIDVFPVDGIPDGHKSRVMQRKRAIFLFRCALACCGSPEMSRNVLKRGIRKVLSAVINSNEALRCQLFSSISRNAKIYKCEETEFVGNVAWCVYGVKDKIRLSSIENPIEVTFEGKIFNAMSSWDEYLTQTYGDYMELPPETDRIAHGVKAWRLSDTHL